MRRNKHVLFIFLAVRLMDKSQSVFSVRMPVSFARLCLLSCLLINILSCNKPSDNNPPTPSQSSDKAITSFVFKANNNSGLTSDVNGIIGQDTIQLTLPFGTVVSSLIPTITFTGKSINPNSSIVQDFTNPVTYTVTAGDGTTKKYVVLASLQSLKATVLFTTRNSSPAFSADKLGYIYAIDASTGNVHWKHTSAAYDFGGSEFVNGILYTKNFDQLIGFNIATKKVKWEFKVAGGFFPALISLNGIVYINCNDGNFYAIDADTRTVKWKFVQDNDDPNSTNPPPPSTACAIADGVLYFGNGRAKCVYALDALTGSLKWKWVNPIPFSDGFGSNPSVVNGIVYVGDARGNMFALNASNGSLKWSKAGIYCTSSPTVVNGVVYSTGEYQLYALDALTGAIKWQFYSALHFGYGSPTVANGAVYVTNGDGNASLLYAIDAITGTEKWRYFADRSTAGSPVVFNDKVYYAVDADLLSIDAKTGKLKWKFTVPEDEQEINTPCIVDEKDNVYYSSDSPLQN